MAWFEAYEQTGRTGRRAEQHDSAGMSEWARESIIETANANAAQHWRADPRKRWN